jgi:ribosome maturation factor RimP
MDLHALIEDTVVGLGYELVDIEQTPKGRLIRLFIDKSDKKGGVDVEDCALVSNQLTRLFMVENIVYDRLEVSSPGLDRPLKKLEHFQRYVGHEIQLKTRLPIGNRRNFGGVLNAVEGEKIRMTVEGEMIEVEFAQVDKARLVPRFDTSGKTGGMSR